MPVVVPKPSIRSSACSIERGVRLDDGSGESDRGAAVEQRAVAVTGSSLIEVEIVGPGQRAERRGRGVLGGQREVDGRTGGPCGRTDDQTKSDGERGICGIRCVFPRRTVSRQGFSRSAGLGHWQGLELMHRPDAEGRVHAHAERRRTVRVLRAELAAGEAAVVDADLGRAAREARAHAAARFAARERAVLAADRAAVAVGVRRCSPRRRSSGSCPSRCRDSDSRPGSPRRSRTRSPAPHVPGGAAHCRRVGHEGGHGGMIGALAVVRGDAGHAADQVARAS